MGFFGSDEIEEKQNKQTSYTATNNNANNSSALTTIAQGATIEGKLKFHSRLQIDGAVTGTIDSNNDITIGKSGFFEGDLTAKKIVIHGIFNGIADCDVVEIAKDGQFKGKVIAKDLIIQSLALFEGESIVKKDKVATPKLDTSTKEVKTTTSASVKTI
jgi:cytoskeletal protein CcmA (bactofilin family)